MGVVIALKSLLDLQTDIGHAYRAALSKIIYMSSGSINTPAFSFFLLENPYFSQDIGNKSMYCKNNMISPVLIGGFVEMDRAL